MSRLSHSQHEIQGILQCSEPELRQLADQADIEDMGALAQDIRDADMQQEDQQRQQQPAGKHIMQFCLGQHGIFAPC